MLISVHSKCVSLTHSSGLALLWFNPRASSCSVDLLRLTLQLYLLIFVRLLLAFEENSHSPRKSPCGQTSNRYATDCRICYSAFHWAVIWRTHFPRSQACVDDGLGTAFCPLAFSTLSPFNHVHAVSKRVDFFTRDQISKSLGVYVCICSKVKVGRQSFRWDRKSSDVSLVDQKKPAPHCVLKRIPPDLLKIVLFLFIA